MTWNNIELIQILVIALLHLLLCSGSDMKGCPAACYSPSYCAALLYESCPSKFQSSEEEVRLREIIATFSRGKWNIFVPVSTKLRKGLFELPIFRPTIQVEKLLVGVMGHIAIKNATEAQPKKGTPKGTVHILCNAKMGHF